MTGYFNDDNFICKGSIPSQGNEYGDVTGVG